MVVKKIVKKFLRDNKAWQLSRETKSKYELIKKILIDTDAKSVLDIGCNAGELTRLSGNDGFFALGIDKNIDLRGVKDPLKNVCLGNIEINPEKISALPDFDAVLLLSVHHQIVKENGDEYAKSFVNTLAKKAKRVFIIEFAGLNSKFSYEDTALFIDNDEDSIKNYAQKWLETALPNHKAEYSGKSPGDSIEPFRYIFKCIPKKVSD